MREAVIVSAARTAIGKAPRGALRNVHTADLAATAIKAALEPKTQERIMAILQTGKPLRN